MFDGETLKTGGAVVDVGPRVAHMAAIDLAAAIRDGRLRSIDLVEACIRRIREVNGHLNAVVTTRFEEAMREARDADARTHAGGPLPPFHGVPCTIKDFFAVAGQPHTGGLVARREHLAREDAPVVARLRKAGAIVLGTTNVPEGGLWMETYNAIWGRTNNPWDLRRTPGGSSGGEAAIIAAGGSPFGLGSDIGGSLRIPAAFCGIFAHKPTGRLVPNGGQFPVPSGEASAFLSTGPMTRSARDLAPLLRILAGPHPTDPVCVAMPIGDPAAVDLRGLVVYPVETNGRIAVSGSLRRAVRRAADALRERGAEVRELELPRLRHSLALWVAMMEEVVTEHYDTILADGSGRDRVAVGRELVRSALGRSPHTLIALTIAGLDQAVSRLPRMGGKLAREARALSAEIDALLGDRGVILHPPYSRPAPRHHDALRTPFDVGHTAVFNVLEKPVTLAPVGFDAQGLPLGVQIIGANGRDHVTIAAACAIEEELGGWVRATPEGLAQ